VLQVSGNNALVARNQGKNCGAGAWVSGENPILVGNRFDENGDNDDIVSVSCSTNCALGEISRNRLKGTNGDSYGIDLSASAPGFTVFGNNVERTLDYGIYISSGTAMEVERNRVKTAGGDTGEPCFYINGTGHIIEGNSAQECNGDGFTVTDSGNTLFNNRAMWTVEHGFNITGGTGNELERNSATNTNGVGFAIQSGATGTIVDSNRASRNRAGACDAGSGTVGDETNNNFGVPLAACPSL
jgi:parallel beta-helix repeat protein